MNLRRGVNAVEHTEGDSFWDAEIQQRKFKPISPMVMRNLGLKAEDVKMVDTIEELRNAPPNIVIAQAAKNVQFVQNFFKEQVLIKKKRYVMGLGVFQQLHYNTNNNQKLLKPCSMQFKKLYNPYLGQPADGKTIVVFRTGGIGDLLFIQPNLRYLKQKYPDCYIKFACGPQYQPMVETWDCVDEMLDLPFLVGNLFGSYHMLFEGVIERCKQAHSENAYNLFSKWLGLDLPDELLVPRQEPKPHLVEECKKKLEEWGVPEKSFIVMQLRASSPIRSPGVGYWSELINLLTERGHNIMLTDNPRQQEQVDKFISGLERQDKVFNFCRESVSLDYTIALTKLSMGTIATDSALNHIAASMDIPCFGLYGPFPGHIRFKTYPKADWIDGKLPCSPCYLHGHRPCPQAGQDGFSPCYETIDKIEIIERFERLVENG
jgi:ADP-heptose:LPS heptosyltransferase